MNLSNCRTVPMFDHTACVTCMTKSQCTSEVSKCEQSGSLLIPIVMSKLPSEIRLRIVQESQEDVRNIKDLIKVVQTEVEAREASENTKLKPTMQPGSRSHSQGSHNHTASAFMSQNCHVQCAYCNASHCSASCDKVCDVKEHKDILIKTGRCFNCLKGNYKMRECLSTRTCRLCQQKHHQSICSTPFNRTDPANPDDSAETSNHTNSDKNSCCLQPQYRFLHPSPNTL